MTISAKNSHDVDLQETVVDELQWTPAVNPADIGVSVHDGAVTLSGEVDTYAERLAAKKATLRVRGVSVVADEIVVRSVTSAEDTDAEIAAVVQKVLGWSASVPKDKVKAEVRDQVVWLTGTVDWDFQRQATLRAVESVAGVRRVENGLTLTRRASASDTQKLIKKALVRNALVDADAITVTTQGAEVTLTGKVCSWAEKTQAGHAAWSSPHVEKVINRIEVHP